jgi:hypothetical protein
MRGVLVAAGYGGPAAGTGRRSALHRDKPDGGAFKGMVVASTGLPAVKPAFLRHVDTISVG